MVVPLILILTVPYIKIMSIGILSTFSTVAILRIKNIKRTINKHIKSSMRLSDGYIFMTNTMKHAVSISDFPFVSPDKFPPREIYIEKSKSWG